MTQWKGQYAPWISGGSRKAPADNVATTAPDDSSCSVLTEGARYLNVVRNL